MSKLVSTIQRNFNKGFKHFDLFKNAILEHKALNTSYLNDYGFKFNNNLNLNLLNNELQNMSSLNNHSYLEDLYNRTVVSVDDEIFEHSIKENKSVISDIDSIDEFVEETSNSQKTRSQSLNTLSNRGLTKVVKRGFGESKKIKIDGNFEELVTESSIFIDKSLLIKEIVEDSSKVILITMPRRWGKSLNLDMLKRFLEIQIDREGNVINSEDTLNYKLFAGGEVEVRDCFENIKKQIPVSKLVQNVPHAIDFQGKSPVIFIDFKNCKGNSFEGVKTGLKIKIQETFSYHKYLSVSNKLDTESKQLFDKYSGVMSSKELTEAEIHNGLKFLSSLLHTYHDQKVWILIDEYDSVTNNAFIEFGKREYSKDQKEFKDDGDFKKLNVLLSTMMGAALKGNPHLEKGVITGILRISKNDMLSSLNNLTEYNLIDSKYSKYYGFNKKEIERLIEHFDLDELGKEQLTKIANGYSYGDQENVYNTWSAVHFLTQKEEAKKANELPKEEQVKNNDYIQDAWQSSGGLNLVKNLIESNPIINNQLKTLQRGHEIICDKEYGISYEDLLIGDINTVWNILLWTGYLTPVSPISSKEIRLKIPNEPVYDCFKKIVRWSDIDIKLANHLFTYIEKNDFENFKTALDDILATTSSHDVNTEKDYHNVLFGILAMLPREKYTLTSNIEAGTGRLDLAIYNKENNKAYILELKYSQHSDLNKILNLGERGLNQINQKNYESYFKSHNYPKDIQEINKISLVFENKTVHVFPSSNKLNIDMDLLLINIKSTDDEVEVSGQDSEDEGC